jgi:hypothetical protein
VINLFEKSARDEKVLHNNIKISPHNTPGLLEEKRGVAIGTRSFLILNIEHSLLNVLIGNWRKEKLMRTWIYARPTLDNNTIQGDSSF